MSLKTSQPTTRLPLLPLSDAVHFPHTDLWVRVVDPAYRSMVEELLLEDEAEPRIGAVLLKPGWEEMALQDGELFTAGTAGRVVDYEYPAEGGISFVLRGEFRFVVMRRELRDGLYHEALVKPVKEPFLSDVDPGIRAMREELLDCSGRLIEELGGSFPLDLDHLSELRGDLSFEELVNHLASHIDVSPLRKQQLLNDALPDRAVHLLGILRSRRKLIELLQPFRHLAAASDVN